MSMNNDEYKLVAKLGNLKTIVQMLKAINFQEVATCFGTQNGLKLTVEQAKCMQANVYIPIKAFEEFSLQEDVIFRINLSVLVECLFMFWSNINTPTSNVALQLIYKDTGYPVTVLIEFEGIITDCSLKTQEPDELLDFNLEVDNVVNKVVMHTNLLKDVLAELDHTSDTMELFLSPTPPYFRISTNGVAGECCVEIPHDSEYVDSFQCKQSKTSHYQLNHVKPAMKALMCADKVSLRHDVNGLLCFQYMIRTEEMYTFYIEYYIYPIVDQDESDE